MKITVHEEKVWAELGCPKGVIHGDPLKLRPSELGVFCLYLRALTAKEIAERLNSTEQYVNNLMLSVRNKLQVRTQLQIAYLAYERGYVVIEEA